MIIDERKPRKNRVCGLARPCFLIVSTRRQARRLCTRLGILMHTIAIIENDLRDRDLLKFWLEDAGYHVRTFGELASALGSLRNDEKFDLIMIQPSTPTRDFVSMLRDAQQVLLLPVIRL